MALKLWMSAEIMADVGEFYQHLSKSIEAAVNHELDLRALRTEFEDWTLIAIILPPGVLDYKEIVRRHIKRKVLEFRLRIDHSQFLTGTNAERCALILDALERSVGLMPKLKVESDDCRVLSEILTSVRRSMISRLTH